MSVSESNDFWMTFAALNSCAFSDDPGDIGDLGVFSGIDAAAGVVDVDADADPGDGGLAWVGVGV